MKNAKKYYLIYRSSGRYLGAGGQQVNGHKRAVKIPANRIDHFQKKYPNTVKQPTK